MNSFQLHKVGLAVRLEGSKQPERLKFVVLLLRIGSHDVVRTFALELLLVEEVLRLIDDHVSADRVILLPHGRISVAT